MPSPSDCQNNHDLSNHSLVSRQGHGVHSSRMILIFPLCVTGMWGQTVKPRPRLFRLQHNQQIRSRTQHGRKLWVKEGETAPRDARTPAEGWQLRPLTHGYDNGHDTWNVKTMYDNDDTVSCQWDCWSQRSLAEGDIQTLSGESKHKTRQNSFIVSQNRHRKQLAWVDSVTTSWWFWLGWWWLSGVWIKLRWQRQSTARTTAQLNCTLQWREVEKQLCKIKLGKAWLACMMLNKTWSP